MSKNDQLYEQLKDLLEANLDPMRKDIREINYAIKGNGQPGLSQRMEKVENRLVYITAIGSICVFAITFFKDPIVKFLLNL